MMSSIRGKDTRGELALRKQLFAAGFRYRVHRRDLPGSPDIVLPRYRAAIMMHGCFWHRHAGCSKCTMPSSNVEFWQKKFEGNVVRDALKEDQLLGLGWRVATVWECGIFGEGLPPDQFEMLEGWIRSGPTPAVDRPPAQTLELP